MSDIDYKKIHELELEIDKLIESNPKLKEYQNQISQKLLFLPDPVDRLTVLGQMMKENLIKMENEFHKLLKLLGE